MSKLPTEPGYYWAKLKTPRDGYLYGVLDKPIHIAAEHEDWVSLRWEIVEVNDNNGEGNERFSVSVFGIPIPQWPNDFFWGPRVKEPQP